jgi:hypothetical protein
MYSRWFNVAVVALWMATMSWLVTSKVLPSILVGEPPNYRTIVEAQRTEPAVAWAMAWNERPMGWALNTNSPLPHGLTEFQSRVHFDDIPFEQITGLRSLLEPVRETRTKLPLDVFSELVFDPLGRLSRFESSLRFNPTEDPIIKLRGVIDGAQLSLNIRSGSFEMQREITVSPESMLNDGLSPQTRLPGLREGQAWTVELYSPLHPPSRPLEVLQVKVEATEPMTWENQVINAWVVVYRKDPGSGGRNAGAARGKLWVRRDGLVLRQQVMLLNSTLTFTRLPQDRAARLARAVDDEKTGIVLDQR